MLYARRDGIADRNKKGYPKMFSNLLTKSYRFIQLRTDPGDVLAHQFLGQIAITAFDRQIDFFMFFIRILMARSVREAVVSRGADIFFQPFGECLHQIDQ